MKPSTSTKVICESCGGPNGPTASFCCFCQAPLGFARKKSQRVGGKLLQDEKPALPIVYIDHGVDQPRTTQVGCPVSPRGVGPRDVQAPIRKGGAVRKKKKVPKRACPACNHKCLLGMRVCLVEDGGPDSFCGTCGSAKVDRNTGQRVGKSLVCGTCEPQLVNQNSAVFANKDDRRSIRVDVETSRRELQRLQTTIGSLLNCAKSNSALSSSQSIAWSDLVIR
jgi:hypothetical protein